MNIFFLDKDPKIAAQMQCDKHVVKMILETAQMLSTAARAQGHDIGTQYRSEIFYVDEDQKKIAEKIIEEKNKKLSGKVVTRLSLIKNYCKAEDYHQKYLEK